MEQNERAKELYRLGFFNPERAQEALGALEMMEFEGKDKVQEQVSQGQTLLNICRQMKEQMAQVVQMAALRQGMPGVEKGGVPVPAGKGGGAPSPGGAPAPAPPGGSADQISGAVMKAHTPMTGYGERLAKRSAPEVGRTGA